MKTPKGFKTPADIALKICNEYVNTNYSSYYIAIKYNVSTATVSRIRKEYNIPQREIDKSKNGSKNRSIIECDENYFEIIDSADKSYWLGFILGDAYLGKDGSLKLELHYEDVEILEKLKESLKSNHKISFRSRLIKETGNLRKTCYINICRRKLFEDLIKHGITMTKSKYCTIPSSIPNEFIRDFIRGVFCSDGGWHYHTNGQITFSICSSVKSFLEEIQEVLMKNCFLEKTKITSNKSGSCHELRYCGNLQCIKIYDYLYNDSNLKLMRKYNSATNHLNLKENNSISKVNPLNKLLFNKQIMNKSKFKELKQIVSSEEKAKQKLIACTAISIVEYITMIISFAFFFNVWFSIAFGIISMEIFLRLGLSLEMLLFVWLFRNNEEVRKGFLGK